MKKIQIFLLMFILLSHLGYTQSDTTKPKPPVVFGSIYPGFVTTLSTKDKPNYAFEMNTALVGFKKEFSNKATAILIYDVTKTTGDITVLDSNGTAQNVSFFKGSDYTAFLKQAEINWRPVKHIELAMGQLLSEQYLTVQDKFWGYRYVAFTFQERYKYGNQADFGFRAAYVNEKLKITAGVFNGEGPLYKQDSNGRLMYTLNAEYRPNEHFIFKIYGDIYPSSSINKQCLSAFLAFKTEKFRVAIEGCNIQNDKWNHLNDYSGVSAFFSYKLTEKWNVFIREDYLEKSLLYNKTSVSFVGVQYEPITNFDIALNYRLYSNSLTQLNQIALNVGIKF